MNALLASEFRNWGMNEINEIPGQVRNDEGEVSSFHVFDFFFDFSQKLYIFRIRQRCLVLFTSSIKSIIDLSDTLFH